MGRDLVHHHAEPNRLDVPLPLVPGYKWGWIRYAIIDTKDNNNLNAAVDRGWIHCVKSPHEALPLNKAGYVTAGDLVLCLKKIKEDVPMIEYLEIHKNL